MFKISDFIDTLDLDVDQTYRGNCPICHGKNTFTVTRSLGNILYNCYKNSCRIAGSHHQNMDAFTIKALLTHGNATIAPESYSEQELCTFELPPYLVPYEQVDYPVDPMFLRRYGIKEKDVMYDIRQDRLVFPVHTESNVLVDAVGRSLNGRQPKWLRYASSPVPYVNGGSNEVAVIVEDAISAYVIGEYYMEDCSCVALLGTQLTAFHKQYITKHWRNVIVALDPDARDKSIKIARELGGKALNLKDDLKYRRPEDLDNLAEMLYGT